jgi:hypothetical protein
MQNQAKFLQLRAQYPLFTYEDYKYEVVDNQINIKFTYKIGDDITFAPKMTLLPGRNVRPFDTESLGGLIFHIGLIELISYWKCTCSPTVHVRGFRLDEEQQQWWKKLYWKGLGEFFHQNGITSNREEFLHFRFDDNALPTSACQCQKVAESNRVIVPIGGGKDSVVTLEHQRKEHEIVPFIINPRGATLECARVAGFPAPEDIVVLRRQIDGKLLELNAAGYLNGHTPFSAMLAFYSTLVSTVTGTREVALSNEASANEPTILGTEINHQYSKSLEFEEDFRHYVSRYLGDCNHYYSYLRPYSELEIARFFAQYPDYFPVFKSCNAGSKTDIWCCNCPKCLFAYIILSPFIDADTMVEIFGEDLLDKPSLQQYFDELTGVAEEKPFECVGTIDEVNRAMEMIAASGRDTYFVRRWKARRPTLS